MNSTISLFLHPPPFRLKSPNVSVPGWFNHPQSDEQNMHLLKTWCHTLIIIAVVANITTARQPTDPLPSWNEGQPKSSIIDFVRKTTDESSPDFIPIPDRIATFDNDGTLWSEQPLYFQFLFAVDRVKQLAPDHPDWKDKQPFKAILENDLKALAKSGEQGEFEQIVRDWLKTARHPQLKKPYTDLVFQPMLELLTYLRANNYKTFIVSGGGVEFMRVFSQEIYGVPPEQVVGSSIKTKFELRDGQPVLVRLPEINFIDDKSGKPVGINQSIGHRPIFAAGNSDGDFEMLQWTTVAKGPRLGMIIHHDDPVREWSYDRHSPVGALDRGLDQAPVFGWQLISMRTDWKLIYPPREPDNR